MPITVVYPNIIMLNIPKKPEKVESFLEQYAQLRSNLIQLEKQISDKEAAAIAEALTVIATDNSLNGKNMIYRGHGLKLILGMRKCYASEKDDPELEKLSEQIRIAELARIQNVSEELTQISDEINSLRDRINQLEQQREQLKQTPYIVSLKTLYCDRRDNSQYLEPYLIVRQG